MVKEGASKSCSGASYKEWHNFMSSSVADMYQKPGSSKSSKQIDSEEEDDMDLRKLLKDVERFGSSARSWKERMAIQNKNVVALGGKLQKKPRTSLGVALPAMKNKKKREQKKLAEDEIFGRYTNRAAEEKKTERRRPEDRVLKVSEGNFKKGILDVKHLLRRNNPPTKGGDDGGGSHKKMSKGKKKGKGKKGGKRRGR